MIENQKFWIVWKDGFQVLHEIYHSHFAAKQEAEELARIHSPDKFYVLEAVTWVQAKPIEPAPVSIMSGGMVKRETNNANTNE